MSTMLKIASPTTFPRLTDVVFWGVGGGVRIGAAVGIGLGVAVGATVDIGVGVGMGVGVGTGVGEGVGEVEPVRFSLVLLPASQVAVLDT